MKNTIYQCTQHLFGWFSSGAGFKDFGFTMPVGVNFFAWAVDVSATSEWLQAGTYLLGLISIGATIYIKLHNFIKK